MPLSNENTLFFDDQHLSEETVKVLYIFHKGRKLAKRDRF